MIRAGYYGNIVKFHYDVEFVIVTCSVMLVLGLLGVRKAVKLI